MEMFKYLGCGGYNESAPTSVCAKYLEQKNIKFTFTKKLREH
jgi:hypothetical protein